jgi:16S rRNA (guanine527-N7)-methyltransferase
VTEDEARAWLEARNVSRETLEQLDRFIGLLRDEGTRQNLISASTMDTIWARHVVDSAQLLNLAEGGDWVDLGSGAGFPGLVIAAIGGRRVTLVESRAKRIAFLKEAADILGVADLVEIFGGRAELLPDRTFAVISARAFAPLPRLLAIAHRLSRPETVWVLPKGKGAARELEEVADSWQGDFRVVPSVTDSEAAIIVASQVRPRKRR